MTVPIDLEAAERDALYDASLIVSGSSGAASIASHQPGLSGDSQGRSDAA